MIRRRISWAPGRRVKIYVSRRDPHGGHYARANSIRPLRYSLSFFLGFCRPSRLATARASFSPHALHRSLTPFSPLRHSGLSRVPHPRHLSTSPGGRTSGRVDPDVREGGGVLSACGAMWGLWNDDSCA